MDSLRYISNERIKNYQESIQRAEREAAVRKRRSEKSSDSDSGGGRKKGHFYRFFNQQNGMDMPFFFLIIILLVIGLVMMFSASYAFAYYTMGDSYYYLTRQAIFAGIGIVVMLLFSRVNYHILRKYTYIILGIAFILAILVLFLPPINNVHRWIGVGVFTIQASEILKFAIVLFYAQWAVVHYGKMDTFVSGVVPAMIIGGISIFLLFLEPHYSAIVIMTLLLAIMMWISGVKVRWFVIGVGVVAAAFFIMQVTGMLKYAMERLDGWGMALEENLSSEMQTTVWQTMNSLYAIGSGGLTGLGLGQSREKYLYLPEPQNDFVFSIVIEEIGLIGGIIILAIFALLVWRGIMISLRAKDRFGMLLGVGLVSQIGLQVVLNILVITDTLPNTGISLPFFSYGGSSLIMLLAQMGIVLSISRNSNINKT